MEWVSLVGAGLVMVALRDLFHTLWHPTRRGGMSRLVMTALWRVSRHVHLRGGVAGLVGPLAMVTVVGMWAATIIVGWAVIYWPHIPEGFTFATGLKAPQPADLLAGLGAREVILYVDDAPPGDPERDRTAADRMYDRAGFTEVDRLHSFTRRP